MKYSFSCVQRQRLPFAYASVVVLLFGCNTKFGDKFGMFSAANYQKSQKEYRVDDEKLAAEQKKIEQQQLAELTKQKNIEKEMFADRLKCISCEDPQNFQNFKRKVLVPVYLLSQKHAPISTKTKEQNIKINSKPPKVRGVVIGTIGAGKTTLYNMLTKERV